MFDFTVTWSEFQVLSENLKPYTEQAMKIEVAPWIKDYVVDMDDLYTELALEKTKNKPTGLKTQELHNYTEMFEGSEDFQETGGTRSVHKPGKLKFRESNLPVRIQAKAVARKILIKGDPGIGKTTLIKKIAWDWATGTFTQFIIVFVVFLKLVKPGDLLRM